MPGTNPQSTRLPPGSEGPGNILATNRLVLLIAVPLFLVLAVVAYLTFQFAANERAEQAWVRHTYEVMESQRRIQDDIQTAETGMRGYLLSRDPAFQKGFQSYLDRIPGDLKTFRDLTTDNPDQQSRALRLEKLLKARALGFKAAVNSNNTEPAIRTPEAMAGLQRGRAQMGAIRAETTAGLVEEQRLLTSRDVQRRDAENLEIAFAIGAGVLVLFILLIAAAMLVRNNVSLAEAEKARANEAAILQATLETVREGIAYFTGEGLLCAFNASFFELLDLPRELARLQQTRLPAFRKLEEGRSASANIFVAPNAEHTQETIRVVWADRELDVYKAAVSTGGFIVGVVDQTARVRAEAMVRQSQKMEAIGHLTGGVAHDFNNLLQIISANLDLAVAGSAANAEPRLRERLQNAIGAVVRGSRLTAQLLAFARRQALEPKSVDLGRVIRDMSDMLRRTLGETVSVETVIAGGLWNTLVDPSQVENTVLNLAINARDAMPNGGKLTLEVANAFLDDTYATAHAEVTPGQYVMLAVTDTGTGMTPEVMARVFEPFFTTKAEGKGTGLGLAQAYGFTKQTGGHIKIYSEVGHGTTIKLYLPRTRREADRLETAAQPAEGGSEHILVVEDDEGVRIAVVDMLDALGYQVSKAENAEAALELLKTISPDLIFTDVVMPGAIHTRDFTARAVAMHPGVRVLYTSGYTQNAIVHNGKLDDDALLLSKPYRKDELARKLRSVFAGTARGPIAPPAKAPGAALEGKRGKVLVVEDVALIRMTTVDMVEQIGFDAIEAADASEALALLQKDDAVTILLTDLGLPGMNGRQLVEEVLRFKPQMKIIIASGYSTSEEEGAKLPANVSYLTKPFDMQQLRRTLEA